MIRPAEIQQKARKEGVRDTQIEKDYILSWILIGIVNNELLSENLAFNGLCTATHKPFEQVGERIGEAF